MTGGREVPEKDLPEKDLPEKDLPEQDLPEKDLPEQDLSEQDLSEQDLSEQDLPEKDLPEGGLARKRLTKRGLIKRSWLDRGKPEKTLGAPAVRAAPLPRPSVALLVVSVLLPQLLFGLAAWQNRRDVLREAEARVERTTQILHEHTLKIFETHQIMLNYIDERLRGVDWQSDAIREAVHVFLVRLKHDAVQVAAITVSDPDGHIIATSEAYPADLTIDYSSRDYFKALKAEDLPLPFVSQSMIGRQSHEYAFNLAQRLRGADRGQFTGVIAISVRRSYFEDFYRGMEHEYDHAVVLTRDDGKVLASEPRNGLATLPPRSPLRLALERPEEGSFLRPSMIEGPKRIFGFEKIGAYPVAIAFSVSYRSALAAWWRNVLVYGLVAFLSSLALLFVSAVAMRQSALEGRATRRWRDTVALLRGEMAERLRVEEQLRQAQKMEAVGRLTGGVAHDFNNLLTIVIGSLDLLSRRLKDGDLRHQTLVHNAMDGATRAAALTARLLAFARQHPLDPKNVDVNALIGGMSNLLRQSLGEAVEIETILTPGLWTAYADPNQLENAVLNLSVNARDAMPQGGSLRIETSNLTLDAAAAAAYPDAIAGRYVTVSISDSGTGMAPEVLSHAFEPFYTTKPVGKGTGLGLSQVYGFTRQSGGFAAIKSQLGEGTSITIYLPQLQGEEANSEVAAAEIAVAPASGSHENRTILIVEDEELVRRFSSGALRDAGYSVLEAATGAEAMDLLRGHPEITLLFTDIVLKGPVNGRALAVQALALRPTLKVLYTSGYRKETNLSQSGSDKASFLAKPFTTAGLSAKIEALLA